jgi:hypothetical protein
MDIYSKLRVLLNKRGIKSYENDFGYNLFSDEIFEYLENSDTENTKGIIFDDRFKEIISDPNNLFIKRHEDSGILKNNIITLHNGLRIYNNCYYDNFTEVLILNKGVHEPSEERSFDLVLESIKKNSGHKIMIELGSYWAFYSMWFKKEILDSSAYCIEPEHSNLLSGMSNFDLNSLEANFTKGFIDDSDINLLEFCTEKNIQYIDVLHSDIQGYELIMLNQMSIFFEQKKINYVFISTHSDELHYQCIDFLNKKEYRIICQANFSKETFHFDGFILACPIENIDIKPFEIGNRSKSFLISDTEYDNLKLKLLNN